MGDPAYNHMLTNLACLIVSSLIACSASMQHTTSRWRQPTTSARTCRGTVGQSTREIGFSDNGASFHTPYCSTLPQLNSILTAAVRRQGGSCAALLWQQGAAGLGNIGRQGCCELLHTLHTARAALTASRALHEAAACCHAHARACHPQPRSAPLRHQPAPHTFVCARHALCWHFPTGGNHNKDS